MTRVYMDRFSAKAALGAGTQLIRGHPMVVTIWASLYLAMSLGMAVMAGFQRSQVQQLAAAPGAGQAMMFGFILVGLVQTLIGLMVEAVMWTSASRGLLRPAESPLLRIGPEESRVFVARLATQFIVAIPLLALTELAELGRAPILAPLIFNGPLVVLFSVVGLLWSALASVTTYAQGRIAIFKVWRAARGRALLLIGLCLGIAFAVFLMRSAPALFDILARLRLGEHPDPVRTAQQLIAGRYPQPGIADKAVYAIRAAYGAVLSALQLSFTAGAVATAWRASEPS